MTTVIEAELLADAAATLGEGPAWDAERSLLSWVDITAGVVHVLSESGQEVERHAVGHPVGAALPAGSGSFLLADASGFAHLDRTGNTTRLLDLLAGNPDMQFNDAKCDPRGRAFAGSMSIEMTASRGTLYRLDPGPTAAEVISGLTVPNGLGWSPDGETLWFADSSWGQVKGYPYDAESGALGRSHTVIDIAHAAGVPDGLCVDDDGCIWTALWEGHEVRRYTPQGRLDTTVRVPVGQVTSCAFGGRGMSTLFITTARSGMSAEEIRATPLAGAVFAADTKVTGPAATPWREL